MELNNEFRVAVSAAETWKVLTDVERIAPMLPGAQLQEVEGDEYRGVVKVKVGPITAQYKGAATFLEKDEDAGRVVLKASGRDTRGQGNASATITATMKPEGDETLVTVVTDLTITGKVAQFGRGVLAEVSSKLLGQFVDALHADLAGGGGSPDDATAAEVVASDADLAAEAAAASAGPGSGSAGPGSGGTGGPSAGSTPPAESAGSAPAAGSTGAGTAPGPARDTEAGGPRRIESKEAEPLDLLAVAGGSTVKRLVPVAVVLLAILALVARRRAGCRKSARRAS